MQDLYNTAGNSCYAGLAAVGLWGAFCVVMVWMRVAQKRFRTEDQQAEFLHALNEPLARGDFESAAGMLQNDKRAVPQLALLAIANRDIGYAKVRELVTERFRRDVLADLEYRISWIGTMIKAAPMLGLLGTVLGMMGAFEKLATAEQVEPAALAENIALALITTAIGLVIAIPLIICMASITVRIRKMEDLVAVGMTRFFESFRAALQPRSR
jgi:biopolymer transport protein ExbB/TolQ